MRRFLLPGPPLLPVVPVLLWAWSLPVLLWAWSLPAAAAGQGAGAEKPPALLEPYAGYDVVFAPQGDRVLGPDAAPVVDGLLSKPAEIAACQMGDLRLEPLRIQVNVRCGTEDLRLLLHARAGSKVQPGWPTTGLFALEPPLAWQTPCDPACTEQRKALQDAMLARLQAGEARIPWQRVRPQPGSAAGTWQDALGKAQVLVATSDRAGARLALDQAVAARPLTDLTASELLDVVLLASEASATQLRDTAAAQLSTEVDRQVQSQDPSARAEAQDLALARDVLLGRVEAVRKASLACVEPRGAQTRQCDLLPAVRALAATGRYADAAALLDLGPLGQGGTPRPDLLKLRFGLASAQGDADGELAVAKRMIALQPDSPDGYDVLSSGLARAGRYREAIETLYDLSKKHPERDIVLGRLAGLVNFLTDAAAEDPAKKADLEAVEAKMKEAAKDPKDVVARFLVATRAYYAGKLQEALPQLEALAQSGNRDPRIPLYLAMTHFWLGHQDKAQALIQHAVEIGPSDPDVFYCRSQIVRKVHLPLAIADMERYEAMTSRPWAVGPKAKADRVAAELDFMRRGLLPPDWDKPGPERVKFDPKNQAGVPVSEDVRLGRLPLAGMPTPTQGLEPPEPPTVSALSLEPTPTGTRAPDVPRPGDAPERPWLPIALLVAVVAALGLRIARRKK